MRTLLSLSLALLCAFPLFAQPEEKEPEKQLEGYDFTGLPLVSFSTDDGFGYGARVYAYYYEKDLQPFKYQAFGQYYKTTRGYEYHEGSLDALQFLGTPWRVRIDAGFERTLNAQWYGYGNYHDLQKEKRIRDGKIPINENQPAVRDLYQWEGEELKGLGIEGGDFTINETILHDPAAFLSGNALKNKSKKELKQSQDKYFNYDRIKPFMTLTTEDWFSKDKDSFVGNLKWFVGIRGQRYKIQSYQDDIESGQKYANNKTLIDLEKPTGYDATEKKRFVNGLRGAIAYDSRPRDRELNPNSGIFTDIHFEGVGKGTGSHYSFNRTTLTWRQYIEVLPSLFNPSGRELVFAYRFLGQKTVGDVPFFEAGRIYTMREDAEGLGGNRGVRGYAANQFVDKVMAISNYEARLTVSRFKALGGIDLVLLGYYDIGRVAPTEKEISTDGLHKAGGGGIRLVWKKNTIINISYGRSQYGANGNFSFNHLF